MSAQQSWELQQAVYSRLTSQLAGDGPGGSDVKVFDHVPVDPDRVHVRLDGFNIIQRPLKADKTQHFFFVHVFDRPTSEAGGARGLKTVKNLQEKIVSALHQWKPSVTGASHIRHQDSDTDTDEDGLTQHAFSRFYVYLSPS